MHGGQIDLYKMHMKHMYTLVLVYTVVIEISNITGITGITGYTYISHTLSSFNGTHNNYIHDPGVVFMFSAGAR